MSAPGRKKTKQEEKQKKQPGKKRTSADSYTAVLLCCPGNFLEAVTAVTFLKRRLRFSSIGNYGIAVTAVAFLKR